MCRICNFTSGKNSGYRLQIHFWPPSSLLSVTNANFTDITTHGSATKSPAEVVTTPSQNVSKAGSCTGVQQMYAPGVMGTISPVELADTLAYEATKLPELLGNTLV